MLARLRDRRRHLNARAPQPASLPMAPSDSARRPPGCARRPSDARSAERGEASSRRCLPACASAAGIRLQPLRAQLRLRRPSDARSEVRGGGAERRAPVARHRRNATVSSASLRFPRGGEARHRARRCTQVRRRTVVSNCALPSSPSQRMRAAGSRPPPFRRRRCLDLLLLLLYLSAVAGAFPASAFAVSAFAAAVAARARPCGKFVALANWLRDRLGTYWGRRALWISVVYDVEYGGNGHVQRWRQRRRRRQARQRVKERVLPFGR